MTPCEWQHQSMYGEKAKAFVGLFPIVVYYEGSEKDAPYKARFNNWTLKKTFHTKEEAKKGIMAFARGKLEQALKELEELETKE